MDKFLFISGHVFMAFICAVLASLNPHMFGEWVAQLRFPAGVLYGAFSVLWNHYYFRKRNGGR